MDKSSKYRIYETEVSLESLILPRPTEYYSVLFPVSCIAFNFNEYPSDAYLAVQGPFGKSFFTMTTRNLNDPWRDVVLAQYVAGFVADIPSLLYIIHASEWNRAIVIEVPNRIPIETFRRSIFDFFHAECREPESDYEDKNLSV